MDCSLPGSSVHGILQARILEWVAMPSSTGSSWPRDWTSISKSTCIGRRVLYHSATWEGFIIHSGFSQALHKKGSHASVQRCTGSFSTESTLIPKNIIFNQIIFWSFPLSPHQLAKKSYLGYNFTFKGDESLENTSSVSIWDLNFLLSLPSYSISLHKTQSKTHSCEHPRWPRRARGTSH